MNTWTIRDAAGTVCATGKTRREALSVVGVVVRDRPGRNPQWNALRAQGWTVERDPPLARNLTQWRARTAEQIAETRNRVLAAATAEARACGFQWITRGAVAERAGVSAGTVSAAFGGMLDLKRAVMRQAVETEDAVIVAQGLADGSAIAKSAPQALKDRAAEALTA